MSNAEITLSAVYVPSDDIVARDIEGEIILVPLAAGIGDLEDDLFSLNDTGREIWQRLDGKRTVQQIIAEMADEYGVTADTITQAVLAFIAELSGRGILNKSA